MEGVGLQLDPDFDIFEVSQPFVRRLVWRLVSPNQRWTRALLLGGADWVELLSALPRAGSRMLEQIERNELFQLNIKDADRIMGRLDRLATRLALSVLVAALIIGLAMLVPLTAPGSLVQWLALAGFITAIGLGLWLLVSLFRTPRQ